MKTLAFLIPLAALTATAATAAPPQSPRVGRETIIPFAANGGLRDWQRGGPISDVLWVRDRTEQWYQVQLDGQCRFTLPLDTLSYTTSVTGNFDKFSVLRVGQEPYQTCTVRSIRTSLPPPGHEGQGRHKVNR